MPFFIGFDQFLSFKEGLGVIAWTTSLNGVFSICMIGLVTGVIGNMAYFESFKYFTPSVIAGSMLLEPVSAQLFGILLGQDRMPGIITFTGGSIVLVGIILYGTGEEITRAHNLSPEYSTDIEMKNLPQLSTKDQF